MAAQAPPLQNLDYAIQQLRMLSQSISLGSAVLAPDDNHRKGLVRALQEVINFITLPSEKLDMLLPQTSHLAALRLLIRWGVFEAIPKAGAIKFTELAASLKADESLITRLVGILVAHGTLQLVDNNRVAHTDLSELFIVPRTKMLLAFAFEDLMPIYHTLPAYFKHFGRKEPNDPLQTPVAYALGMLGTKIDDVWHADQSRSLRYKLAEASTNPEQAAVRKMYRHSWIASRAARALMDEDRAVVVDVSGDEGAGLAGLLRAYPEIPGRQCVLEDTQDRLIRAREHHRELARVLLVPRDQLTDPPSAKGAFCYHIHHRLCQCHEAACVDILTNIAAAMLPDSKLLIAEMMLSSPPTVKQTFLDMNKILVAGQERSLPRWKMVMRQAGLSILGIQVADGGECVIECMLKGHDGRKSVERKDKEDSPGRENEQNTPEPEDKEVRPEREDEEDISEE